MQNAYRQNDPHADRKASEREAARKEREALIARKAIETSGKRIVYARAA